jgi:NAD(P)-dependent dehydrogenase (short-subunit alcohol dehydrogenase family)
MDSFAGKVVLITGAASGLGRAYAKQFAGEGADLILADIKPERLAETKGEVASFSKEPLTAVVDVSSKTDMESFAERVLAEKGGVDVLINNAGVGLGGELKDMTLEEWEWVMGVNFWGVVYGLHYFLPGMIERKSGHIVNVASANGIFSFPFNGVYCASKHAVVGLSESLRAELKRFGVGVTAVCPGMMKTNIVEDALIKPCSEKSRRFMQKFTEDMDKRGADPSVVAKGTVLAIRKNKAIYVTPYGAPRVYWFYRFFPGAYRWIIGEVAKRSV